MRRQVSYQSTVLLVACVRISCNVRDIGTASSSSLVDVGANTRRHTDGAHTQAQAHSHAHRRAHEKTPSSHLTVPRPMVSRLCRFGGPPASSGGTSPSFPFSSAGGPVGGAAASFHRETPASPAADPGISEHCYCRRRASPANLGDADPGPALAIRSLLTRAGRMAFTLPKLLGSNGRRLHLGGFHLLKKQNGRANPINLAETQDDERAAGG